jgi:hypothetical protein
MAFVTDNCLSWCGGGIAMLIARTTRSPVAVTLFVFTTYASRSRNQKLAIIEKEHARRWIGGRVLRFISRSGYWSSPSTTVSHASQAKPATT